MKAISDFQEWNPHNQGKFVRLLSSPRYMHTTSEDGTGARGIMIGLSRYLTERGVGELKIKDGADAGILDSAVALRFL